MKKLLFILTLLAVTLTTQPVDYTWKPNKVWWIDRGDWSWRDYHPVGFTQSLSNLHAQDVTCNPYANNCSVDSSSRYAANQTSIDPEDAYPITGTSDESSFVPWEDEDCPDCK